MAQKLSIVTLDTETIGLTPKNYVYDVGLVFHDKAGNIVCEYNALVKEIFTDGKMMTGAYFAAKTFSHYAPMLQSGEIMIKPWAQICQEIQALVIEHKVSVIAAYNLGFDKGAMTRTGQLLGSKAFPVPPLGKYKMLDIWLFACTTKLQQKAYHHLAHAMDWVSNAGNVKTTAENAFRYVSGQHDFDEDHTALSDARIETKILAECYRMKKKVPYGQLLQSPWKLAQVK